MSDPPPDPDRPSDQGQPGDAAQPVPPTATSNVPPPPVPPSDPTTPMGVTPGVIPAVDGPTPRPTWVVPVIVGIVALAVVVLALILRSGNDDGSVVTTEPSTDSTIATDTTTQPAFAPTPDTAEPASTPLPETTPAPETTLTPETTTPPESTEAPTTQAPVEETTTVPTSETPPGELLAAPASDLDAGDASLATVDGVFELRSRGTCSVTATIGLQAESSVLSSDDSATIYVVDVYFDEGAEPYIEVADMTQAIGTRILGETTADSNSRWFASLPDPADVDQLTLEPLDGVSAPINLSFNRLDPQACAGGFWRSPSPFAPGEQVGPIDQFADGIPGNGFAVLAACADNDDSYITSGGGLLSTFFFPAPPTFQASLTIDVPGAGVFWLTPESVTETDQFYEQSTGGDERFASQVVSSDGMESGYLTYVIEPRGDGGLQTVACSD